MTRDLDLDVHSPDMVAKILRNAAEEYEESANELRAAWQDKHAGHEWIRIARLFERIADMLEKDLS